MKNKKIRMKNSTAAVGLRKIICASIFFILCLSLFIFTSCSTQKAKWLNIRYHNTTCHYNVWWNGNESLKMGREKLTKTSVDDFTSFLPPEKVATDEATRSAYPDFDRAIEKGVKGVTKHSIFVKGEEHVPYIKECYLLTAYATFYKQDYPATYNTCNILLSQFPGTRAADEAAVLIARCLVREKRYSEAEATLDQLHDNFAKGNFASSQRDKLYIAMVEATLPQEKYKKTVEFIHLATEAVHDRQTKARLTFLLAQIYQQLDRRSVAAKYYHRVLSYGPEYVMEFNARLGEASCAPIQDIQKLDRQLDNMLRDKKNEEYRDQIYFAKGEMYLGAKDAQRACENYRRSVATASRNKAQKAKSSLRLASTLYDLFEDYDQAQLYYDTAMQCIKPDYPGYSAISRRSKTLNELVTYTRVIHRCDSLVHVASLPEEERNALIQSMIDTLNAKEQRAKEQALLDELLNEAKAAQNTLSGDWYFYNPNTVQKGKDNFRQRWGVRTLEDNWCLSSKPNMNLFSLEENDDDSDSDTIAADTDTIDSSKQTVKQSNNPNDPHNPAYYLKDLPRTQAQYDSIDSLVALCLLNAGYIYYDGINNIPRALQCYHRLAEDYTSFPHIVQAFYMLYRIYDRQGNTPQSNYYRDMVLLGFPDSDFANLIRDNEYYKELLRREHVVEQAYDELYSHFSRRHYSTVVALADQAAELYPAHPMLPKFQYWKGLALARQGQNTEAVALYNKLLASLPSNDTLRPLVQSLVERIQSGEGESELVEANEIAERSKDSRTSETSRTFEISKASTASQATENPEEDEPSIYRYRPGQQYYIVLLVNDRHIRATELQYRIADFNTQYYTNSGYKVNASLFDDTTQLITVYRFKNEQDAMVYYHHLNAPESPLSQYASSDWHLYAVSTQNYATFYNRKDYLAYDRYFRRQHLK